MPDVMHDVLEGSLQLEVKELIRFLISSKSIQLSDLNEAIRSFPYVGTDSTNKPAPISASTVASRDHLVKQTGMNLLAACVSVVISCCNYSNTNVVFGQTTSTHDRGHHRQGGSQMGQLLASPFDHRLHHGTGYFKRLGGIPENDH